MKFRLYLLILFLNNSVYLNAQIEKGFELIDLRNDSIYYGLTYKSNFISIPTSINKSIHDFVISKKLESDKFNDLMILLHSYYFVTNKSFQTCHIEMTIFKKKNDQYYELAYIDTSFRIQTKSKINIDNILVPHRVIEIEDLISKFIQYKTKHVDSFYTYNELLNFNEYFKEDKALYTKKELINGVYLNYDQFLNQKPNFSSFIFELDENYNFRLAVYNKSNKLFKLKSYEVYAVVKDGEAYIANNGFDFYPLTRKNSEFYFHGQLYDNPNLRHPKSTELAMPNGPSIGNAIFGKFNSKYSFSIYDAKINFRSGKIKLLVNNIH